MSRGLEPYTSGELQAWLKKRGYRPLQQTGSHMQYTDGALIVPAGSCRSTEHVTIVMADRLASLFGHDAKWLREQLGHKNTRRAGGGRIPPPPTMINPNEALRSIIHTAGGMLQRHRRFTEREQAELAGLMLTMKRIGSKKQAA